MARFGQGIEQKELRFYFFNFLQPFFKCGTKEGRRTRMVETLKKEAMNYRMRVLNSSSCILSPWGSSPRGGL